MSFTLKKIYKDLILDESKAVHLIDPENEYVDGAASSASKMWKNANAVVLGKPGGHTPREGRKNGD